MCHLGIIGMESQRYEGLETACFILELAQPNEMIDSMFGAVNMAIEHGGIGVQAKAVSRCGAH